MDLHFHYMYREILNGKPWSPGQRELASDGKGLCDSVLADSIKFSLGFGVVGGQNRTTVGFLLSNADEFFSVQEELLAGQASEVQQKSTAPMGCVHQASFSLLSLISLLFVHSINL